MFDHRLKHSNWIKRFAVIGFAVTLMACSQSFVYSFLPRLILWEVDDYVTLTSEQSDRLLDTLEDALEVHRTEHIPFYIREMDSIESTIRTKQITPQTIESWYGDAIAYRRDSLAWIAPLGVEQLQGLSLQQRLELVENLVESLEDRRLARDESPKTDEEKRATWAEERIESTEELLGDLTEEQKSILIRSVNEQLDNGDYWYEYRSRWLLEFEFALRASDWDRVDQLIRTPEAWYGAEYEQRLAVNREKAFDTIATFINSLNDGQRNRFFEQWSEWRELLVDIVGTPV